VTNTHPAIANDKSGLISIRYGIEHSIHIDRSDFEIYLVLAEEVDGARQKSDLAAHYGDVDDWNVECWSHDTDAATATAANCTQTTTFGIIIIL